MDDRYEMIEKIGEGTYGKVFRARDKHNPDNVVAVKKARLELEDQGIPSTALREVSLLMMLNDSNHVVRLYDVDYCEENAKACLYLVFEYVSMDLKKFMDRNGKGPSHPLPTAVIKNLAYQLLKGLLYCHKRGVMHRDLKPQNLLIDESKHLLKIADLGLARAISIPLKCYTHEVVTLWYRAPEILLGSKHYSMGVDIWSVGCILAELYKKAPLFPGDSEFQQLMHIFTTLGTPNTKIWPELKELPDWHEYPQWTAKDLTTVVPNLDPLGADLLKKMLEYDPSKRISALEALEHPYFDDVDKARIDALDNPDMRAPKRVAMGHMN